jgi:hypothetical protein
VPRARLRVQALVRRRQGVQHVRSLIPPDLFGFPVLILASGWEIGGFYKLGGGCGRRNLLTCWKIF